ncbi:class I SAM-dependent methyltransferase [Fontimonas sp. SYSU GA230001]|uniref:class I SAM-dependent methyltransferase n=1 Tax=Fontimonas sp. SYSU GA230001 TaxID=3142450 RepID=UPI0032B4D4B3
MNATATVKRWVRTVLGRVPGGPRLMEWVRRERFARRWGGRRSAREIFSHFYETNRWQDAESVSGPGSTLAYTRNIRAALPDVFARYGVRRILDAPCGDYNWFRHVPRPGVSYLGADIVPALVRANQARYGDATTAFAELDIIRDPLPAADLWLCRDALFHFSEADIFRTLENLARSEIQYVLTSNHPACDANRDIATGGFRQLNLRLPPFDFPPPLLQIDDWIEGYPQRQLCLWTREAILTSLRDRRSRAVSA